ncbi:MAG: class I SAM-dependent methyltransferase [Elusimicrobia bacterium]|nr:class I SAM-dependent methyltransferase [Elusimicrobiota bacterium]
METVPCPVCGGAEPVELFSTPDPDGLGEVPFRLVRCRGCGLPFVNPRPTASELGRFYFREYYKKPSPLTAGLVAGAVRLLMRHRAGKILRRKASGRVLDVGCGEGSFAAELARRGWEAWGVEVSPDGAALARGKGLIVFDKPLTECGLPEGHFDVVTLWHSVEHLADPEGYLREVRRVLKHDGVAFLAFPNGDGLEFRVFGPRWFHLDPPRHLYQFSPATMARLLEKAGLRLESVDPHSWEYNPFGFYQSALNAVSTEMNFVYKLLKGVRMPRLTLGARAWNLTAAAVLTPVLAPLAFVYAFLASSFGVSGCVAVYAVKSDAR